MPVRDRFRILAPFVVAGLCLMAAPAAAETCTGANCKPAAAPQKPLKLNKFRRQPIALGKAAQVVKTTKGTYARVKLARGATPKPASLAQREPPQFMPVVVTPEAAAALAMQDSVAQAAAQVRVVEPDELNEIDRAADTPLVPVLVPTSVEPPVQVASADQANDADRNNAMASAVPAATVIADRTAPIAAPTGVTTDPGFDLRSWLARLGSWLSDTWSTLVVAVRSRFG